jgi:predicted nuclease of predicted toxin-antitoxin system
VRFLVDANLSPHVAEWLRVLAEAASGRRILLTSDLDFGEILARSSGRVSVLILRLRSTASANVIRRLEVALARAAPALEDGAVVIVGETSLRLRRLPLGRRDP